MLSKHKYNGRAFKDFFNAFTQNKGVFYVKFKNCN